MDNRIIVMASAFFGVSLGLFFVLMSLAGQLLRSRKKLFVYILLFAAGFTLVAFLGLRDVVREPFVMLVFFQVLFLLMGIIHTYTMYRHFSWNPQRFLFPELTFTCMVWVIGMVPFLLLYRAVRDGEYLYLALGTSLFFLIPFLLIKTYESAMDIPEREAKRWFYPVQSPPEEPDERMLQKPLVIAFLMPKHIDDDQFTNFRAKAPAGMVMGDLFYFFMEDYNARNAGQTIDYADKYGRAHGWVFYFKPRWYLLYHKRYIDPDLTIAGNRIKENSVIVCEREAYYNALVTTVG
jgi:hypothetical protein